jgi:hypothetical protein
MFWDPLDRHYKIDPSGAYGNGIFMDSFFAQNVATTLGLPPLVSLDHQAEHMRTVYPQQMQARSNGHLVGPPNVAPNSGPIDTTMQPIEEEEVWPGPAMMYAGTFLQAAQETHDDVLKSEGLQMAHALEYWLTEDVSLGFLFEGPEGWHYKDPAQYRSPSMNRTRTTLGVLDTIKPIVTWAVPPPPAAEYPS